MPTDIVTGLTEAEEKELDEKTKIIMQQNSITTMYSPYYMAFAKTIMKKSAVEAQIELNTWNARGLSKSILLTIAKDVCNKDLV